MLTVKIMVIKINVQGLVWRLNISWIWWFYETFWDLAEKSRHSPFSVNWKCWKCQSNGVAVQTVWWLLPFLDLLQFLLLLQGCFSSRPSQLMTPTASLHKKSLCCWRKVRNKLKFRERYHCSASFLASEADFNQLVKYESDSDCSDVDSTEYDSEELVNGKPFATRSGRQVKRGYDLMF